MNDTTAHGVEIRGRQYIDVIDIVTWLTSRAERCDIEQNHAAAQELRDTRDELLRKFER